MNGYVYTYDNIVLSEMNRNHAGTSVFEEFFQRAYGMETVVVINHHLVFKRVEGSKKIVQEVPSADSLLFSKHYMSKVFGEQAESIMRALLLCAPQDREAHLARELELLRAEEIVRAQRSRVRQPLALQGRSMVVSTQPEDYPPDEGEHNANKV